MINIEMLEQTKLCIRYIVHFDKICMKDKYIVVFNVGNSVSKYIHTLSKTVYFYKDDKEVITFKK